MKEIEKGDSLCRHCGYGAAEYTQPLNALKINTILCGRYLVGRVMGQGGFGITYVGYDLKLELKVAIKEYCPKSLASRDHSVSNVLQWTFSQTQYQKWKECIERFSSEARKMAKLDELSGIVRVRDCFQENQTAYIVMDFAEGITLQQYLKQNGKIDFCTCVDMLLPIMDSLGVMHTKGLIHRDISPDNLMVLGSGRDVKVKLLDFGAAVDMAVEHSGTSESIVKKGYSAPEQYMEDGAVGGWTDVYAMAAVIYRCSTGEEIPEAMERIPKPSQFSLKGMKNKKARDILTKALAVKPEERIRTMAELKALLEKTVRKGGRPIRRAVAAAAVLAVCGAGAWVYAAKPWLPTVQTLGTTNGNLHQGANYGAISNKYEYYVDMEWNLYVCEYDKEDKTFYINEGMIVDEDAGFINIGKSRVYFLHDSSEDPEEQDSIMEMSFDGSKVKTLVSSPDYTKLQYVQYSNEKEMLYYMKENGDEDDFLYTLCRYNLETKEEEELLEEDIYWYNLDGRYLYYITFPEGHPLDGTQLKRAYLNGKDAKLLNDKDYLINGYIENDTAYMFSLSKEQLVVCDLEGTPKENPLKEEAGQIYQGCSLYSDGWIYYSPTDSSEIHKIRTDGTGAEVIYSGENVLGINGTGKWLWFITGEYKEDGDYRCDHTFLIYQDGSSLVALGGYATEDGLIYNVADGEITITGYRGEDSYVVVPWKFDEGEWKGKVSESFPEDIEIYKYAKESEFTYEKNEDETGITLTEYVGEEKLVVFPEEIEGLPVTAIQKEFAKDNEILEGVIFGPGLETIGEDAFLNCTSLKYVKLPEGLKTMEYFAFYNTAIKEVTLPASLESLYAGAFSELEGLTLESGSEKYQLEDGILYEKGSEGTSVKLVLTAKEGECLLPQGTKTIASYAFTGSQVTSVIMPMSVENVYTRSFWKAEQLKKVVISEGTKKLSPSCFRDCTSLEDLSIPRSVKSIEADAFSGCSSLKSVTISSDCQLGENAFGDSVTIHYYE